MLRFLALALLVAPALAAQQAAPRVSGSFALGAGPLPDVYGPRCSQGEIGAAGVDVAGAVQYHARSPFVLELNTRVAFDPLATGCAAVLGPFTPVGPNEYELSGIGYPPGIAHVPVISMLRAGVETKPGPTFARAMIGGGFVWGKQSVPAASLSGAVGIGGRNTHVYFEFEQTLARVRAYDVRTLYADDLNTSLGTTVTPIVLRPRWLVGRVGVAFPL